MPLLELDCFGEGVNMARQNQGRKQFSLEGPPTSPRELFRLIQIQRHLLETFEVQLPGPEQR